MSFNFTIIKYKINYSNKIFFSFISNIIPRIIVNFIILFFKVINNIFFRCNRIIIVIITIIFNIYIITILIVIFFAFIFVLFSVLFSSLFSLLFISNFSILSVLFLIIKKLTVAINNTLIVTIKIKIFLFTHTHHNNIISLNLQKYNIDITTYLKYYI